MEVDELKAKAVLFRKEILEILNAAGSGHPGGSLSAVEILLTLYGYKMNHRPDDPQWEDRDRLIISKGHVTPVVYVTLANFGYFSKEEYKKYRKYGGKLQGHVHSKVPGVEFNTGSLGHGLSVANGIALGAKMLRKNFRAYCLLGDGEIQEGSVWESAMMAAHHKLDNVCAIVDYNKVQENGPTNDIKNLEPLADKWRSFGWHVVEVIGHNIPNLIKAFDQFGTVAEKPFVIIAHTIKGKGVSFMEGEAKWHGKAPNADQLKEALAELE
jgi:transketolase